MWIKEVDCNKVVTDAWNDKPSHLVLYKLEHTKEKLKVWHNLSFRKLRRKIDQLSKKLQLSKSTGPADQSLEEESVIREWLKEGDKNTAFFHKQMSQRRKNNTIKGLEDENEGWCDKESEIQSIATNYFKLLFKLQSPIHVEEVLDAAKHCITDESNNFLNT